MIRKFTVCLMTCLTLLIVSSCKDEAPSPPKPSFTVNATSGIAGVTKFTFTINQVSADALTLFPYGVDHGAMGTVSIDPASFSGNQATVVFTYATVGTWQAVVRSNNHSGDGKSVKNTESDPVTITISNNQGSLDAANFTLGDYTKDAKNPVKGLKTDTVFVSKTATSRIDTIKVTLPYGVDVTKLRAIFSADQAAVVTANGTTQQSATTENNFTTPVVYTVKSADGSYTSTYRVVAIVKPVEKWTGIKAISGKLQSKSVKDRAVQGYADSVANTIAFIDTLGSAAVASTRFDSVRVNYALDGSFAVMKYGSPTGTLKVDSMINIGGNNVVLTVKSQDSTNTSKAYKVFVVDAPKMDLLFYNLKPKVKATQSEYNYVFNVLTQSDKHYDVEYIINQLPANTNVVRVDAIDGDGNVVNLGGLNDLDDIGNVNFATPVSIKVTLHNSALNGGGGLDYVVTYKASLKQN